MPKSPRIELQAIYDYAEERRLERQKIENERQLELELLKRIADAVERIAELEDDDLETLIPEQDRGV